MQHVPYDGRWWKQLGIYLIVGTWMVVLFCYNANHADITELKSAIIGGFGIVLMKVAGNWILPLFEKPEDNDVA